MGGTSKSETTQSSTTAPWAPTQGLLGTIVNQLGAASGNTGLTNAQGGALDAIAANSNANSSAYTPSANSYVQSLFNGGGALNQSGLINNAYGQYAAALQPLASNTNYDPRSTPGFSDAINAATSDITNQINGSFAAAGRDMSGANTQALARGLTQGLAPIIQQQYQNNVNNQQNAASNLFGAGTTTGGILSGLQQQYLANQGQGLGAANDALNLQNNGANATLATEAQRFGIPIQNLGLLANLGIPIAGLGSQNSGQSSTTSQMSGAQQFATILGGIGSLIPKGPITFGGGS